MKLYSRIRHGNFGVSSNSCERGFFSLCRVRLHVRSTDVAIQITYVKRFRPDCKLLIEPGFTCACVHLLTNSFDIENLKNSPPDVQLYLSAPWWLQWIKFRTQNYDSDDSGGPHSGRQQPVKSLHPTRRILKVNYSALNGRNSFLSHVIWPPLLTVAGPNLLLLPHRLGWVFNWQVLARLAVNPTCKQTKPKIKKKGWRKNSN